MKLIDEIYCWAAIDEVDQIEGMCAFLNLQGEWMPLLAADKERLDSIRHMAVSICNRTNQTLRLLKLSTREVIETMEPGTRS
jgi:hypothetical protein